MSERAKPLIACPGLERPCLFRTVRPAVLTLNDDQIGIVLHAPKSCWLTRSCRTQFTSSPLPAALQPSSERVGVHPFTVTAADDRFICNTAASSFSVNIADSQLVELVHRGWFWWRAALSKCCALPSTQHCNLQTHDTRLEVMHTARQRAAETGLCPFVPRVFATIFCSGGCERAACRRCHSCHWCVPPSVEVAALQACTVPPLPLLSLVPALFC